MRNSSEIVAELKKHTGPLDFFPEVVIPYLPYDLAKPYLMEGVIAAEWVDCDDPLTEMRDYMGFGWDKAANHRGLSASRTISKMRAWLWLLGDEDINTDNFQNYGAPILMAICKKYHFPIPEDEGLLRMAQGLPCREGCEEGCGQ